jgi:DedD protein
MSDEGFHEIQLNGKQLVFLFMAATVVSVVIFLCGVMVGRGVQTARAGGGEAAQTPASEVRAVEPARAGETPSTGSPPTEEPAPVEEDYYDRLVEGTPPEALTPRRREPTSARGGSRATESRPEATPERPRQTAQTSTPPPARPEESRQATAQKAPQSPPAEESRPAVQAPVASGGATASGFAVQLAALRERGEADAIAKRLVAKGYQAYVLLPAPGAPPVYRVQVGRFESRGEADRVAARLRREERFDPWVTR